MTTDLTQRPYPPILVWGIWIGLLLLAVLAGFFPVLMLLLPAAALLILAIRRPQWLIIGLAAYTVLEETLLRWLPTTARFAVEVAIVLLLVLTVGGQVWRQGTLSFRRTPVGWPLLLFVAVAAISMLVNQVPLVVALLGVRPWLRYVVLFYLVTLLPWRKGDRLLVVKALLLVAVLEAGLGLLQAVAGPAVAAWFAAPDVELGGRITQQIQPGLVGAKIFGTLARYDRFGNYLMLMFLLAAAMLPVARPRHRRLLLAGTAVMGAAILLSFSRQAWLGLLAGMVVITSIDKRRQLFLGLVMVLALLPVVFLVSELPTQSTSGGNPATIGTRLLEPFTERYWYSVNQDGGRVYYLAVVGPRLLEASPLVGLGPGRFGSLVTRLYPTTTYDELGLSQWFADNFSQDIQWMAILGQVGVLGLLALAWLWLRLFAFALRRYQLAPRRSFDRGIYLAFMAWTLAVILISFLGPNIEVRAVSLNYWLLGGLICVESRVQADG